MEALGPTFRIFAKPWNMRGLSEGFQGGAGDTHFTEMLCIMAAIVAVGVVLLLFERFVRNRHNRATYNSPNELFRELCRVHRLDRSSRRLMKRLAAERGLASPSFLFVEPEAFNLATLPATWEDYAEQVKQIHHQLFEAR
jgi:hypothetical protein